MNLIERNNCILTNNEDLEYLYTFKDFPIFMGCVETDINTDVKKDMVWYISKDTGIIQLKKLIPIDILYMHSHGSGSVGKLWNEHHSTFSKFLLNFEMKNVLEIGGGHNILANNILNVKNDINWTIIDPNSEGKNETNITSITEFFDDKISLDKSFDTIVFSHLFEHTYDPNIFLLQILKLVKNDSYILFSVPNMKVMLENKYTNCLNFEHTLFLIEPYIEYLFDKYEFELIKKDYFKKDHSIFYAYKFNENYKKNITLSNMKGYYEQHKETFLSYVDYHEQIVKKINDFIKKNNYEIYLFGAHIFSQYLISFGLDTNNIVSILDNDVKKHNKRLYGTNLYVESPKCLIGKNNVFIILCTSVYNDEIKNDILNNINNNVNFLEFNAIIS